MFESSLYHLLALWPWACYFSLLRLLIYKMGTVYLPLSVAGKIKNACRASLVAQLLRIHLPMQGTQVRALVREDPTCCRATKPRAQQLLSLRSRAREPQLLSPLATTTEAHAPRARAPQQGEATTMRSPHTAMKSSPLSPQLGKDCA